MTYGNGETSYENHNYLNPLVEKIRNRNIKINIMFIFFVYCKIEKSAIDFCMSLDEEEKSIVYDGEPEFENDTN